MGSAAVATALPALPLPPPPPLDSAPPNPTFPTGLPDCVSWDTWEKVSPVMFFRVTVAGVLSKEAGVR